MMPEKKKSREGEISFGFGDIFKGIGNFIEQLSDLVEEEGSENEGGGERKRVRTFRGKGPLKDLKGVYGVSVRVGLGGAPKVETFGNIKQTKQGPVVEEMREPLIDVFDEVDSVRIIAELPGVEMNQIKVDLKDDILTITAEGRDRKYQKEILLPAKGKRESLRTSYRNGILEIALAKAGEGA